MTTEERTKYYDDFEKKFAEKMQLIYRYSKMLMIIVNAENKGVISAEEADENISFIGKDTMNTIGMLKEACEVLLGDDLDDLQRKETLGYYEQLIICEIQLKEVLGS